MNTVRVKVILVGNSAVGKTSLVRRYVSNEFSERHIETLGARVEKRTISLPNAQVEMMIWDLAGEQDASNLKQSFVQGANGVLYVGDIANCESLKSLEHYASHCRSLLEQPIEFLLLNKSDLGPAEGAVAIVDTLDLNTHWSLSAKTGDRVEAMFNDLAARLLSRLDAEPEAGEN